jgi:CDP-diacylglycerol--glycerol-3-phosphate 3-phosphatidyltransferase
MASTVKQDIFNVPNSLTMLRIFMIPVVMWLIWRGDPKSCMLAAIFFTLAAITDFFDGYIARKRNLVSMTGKFLDPLADKLIVMATLVMLAAEGRLAAWIVVIIVAREISITGLRALAATEGILINSRSGGKFKTAFQLVGLIGLIIHYEYVTDWWLASSPIDYHVVGFWLLMVSVFFSLYSGWEYFLGFLKGIGELKP